MTRVRITEDEAYPVYSISIMPESFGLVHCDLPDSLIERYNMAQREWTAVQIELGKAYKAEEGNRQGWPEWPT